MNKVVSWIAATLVWLLASTSTQAGARHYYYTDPQGTVLAKADAAGNIIDTSDYRPYGARVLGASSNGPGYTGHVNDADSGLVYMQSRYYDPAIGRFLSVDPVTFYDKPQTSFNRYVYALDNPSRFIDPDGRDSVGEMIDTMAMQAAGRGDGLATYGWAFAATAWNVFGAEGVSQIADKGTGAGKMNSAMAVLEVATLGKGGAIVRGGEKLVEGGAKLTLKMGSHAVDQAITRGVKPASILDAIRSPLKVTETKIDSLGRPSQKMIGEKATIAVNPETGKIITVHPTSSKVAEKLLRASE